MSIDRRLLLLGLVGAGAMVSGCGGVPALPNMPGLGGGDDYGSRMPLPQSGRGGYNRVQAPGRTSFPEIGFADWSEADCAWSVEMEDVDTGQRSRLTNALSGCGHQRDFSFESHDALISMWVVCRC